MSINHAVLPVPRLDTTVTTRGRRRSRAATVSTCRIHVQAVDVATLVTVMTRALLTMEVISPYVAKIAATAVRMIGSGTFYDMVRPVQAPTQGRAPS